MRGLVLGKFLPYHLGHAHLIRAARRRVEELVVLVCSLERESIPGGLRFQWVRQSHADCLVVHVAEEVPQRPEDHPDFWEIWTALIARYAGRVDHVFTSEQYGDELARRLGAEHTCIDLERRIYPVSGSTLRADPIGNWRFVPPVVRPFLVRRVALIGPESSGKTTLAAALAARYGTSWVPEFGREYSEGRDPRTFSHIDFEAIAWGQANLEDAIAGEANGLLLCDTELHTTCTWSDLILGECRDWIRAAAAARRYDAILLLGHDLPWVDDGTRVLELRRAEHVQRLQQELRRAGRSWRLIDGNLLKREAGAVRAIEQEVLGRAVADLSASRIRTSIFADRDPEFPF